METTRVVPGVWTAMRSWLWTNEVSRFRVCVVPLNRCRAHNLFVPSTTCAHRLVSSMTVSNVNCPTALFVKQKNAVVGWVFTVSAPGNEARCGSFRFVCSVLSVRACTYATIIARISRQPACLEAARIELSPTSYLRQCSDWCFM